MKTVLAVLALLGLAAPASAFHVNGFAFHRAFFHNRAILSPTFSAYAVPVTLSYPSAVPVGVVQSTWTATQPAIAASYGAPGKFTTEYLVQQPVTVTTAYLAPQVTYSSPLYFGTGSYGGGYGSQFFIDRGILGVGYNRSFFGGRSFATGGGIGAAIGGRNSVIAASAGGIGGANVNVVEQRSGLLGLRRTQVIQANAGGAAVNVVNQRSGLFGLRQNTVVQASAGAGRANANVVRRE